MNNKERIKKNNNKIIINKIFILKMSNEKNVNGDISIILFFVINSKS